MNQLFRSQCLRALVVGAVAAAQVAVAQPADTFDGQLQAAQTALQAGQADAALAAADAAVRDEPERWEGYALSGRALLALRNYESAIDALSHAIERAPAAQQPELRGLRREAALDESAAAAVPAAPPPPVAAAPAPIVAPPPIAPAAPPPPTVAPAAAPPVAVAPAATPPAATPPIAAAPTKQVAARRRKSRSSLMLFSPNSPEAGWTDDSGLIWARPWYYPASDVGPFNYKEATAVCAGLTLLGAQDWRMPTIDELQRVYLPSKKTFRFSGPKFDPDFGIEEAIKRDAWQMDDFTVDGDTFNANRLLIWSGTPGKVAGEHEAVYFGRPYSVPDTEKVGSALRGTVRRVPFHAYVLCVRNGPSQAAH